MPKYPRKYSYNQVVSKAPRTGVRYNEDGSYSTHLMTSAEIDGKNIAFPTLFQNQDGSWYEADDPYLEAQKRGEVFEFRKERQARKFAEGNWKNEMKKNTNRVKVNKYRLGSQQVAVPDKGSIDTIASPTISLASTGGSMFGPIGAGIGAIAGLGFGLAEHAQMNRMHRLATDQNKYIQRNTLAEDPRIQAEQQYPDGSKGVVTYTNPNGTTYTGRTVKGSRYKKVDPKPVPHYTPIIYGHNFGQMENRYNNGTKAIEVEKDELIFKRVGNKYLLKADFKGGKTHEQGGEDYVAQEGDVIFPGKDRKKVMNAYRNNDHLTLESMRMNLPKDTNKAKFGLDNDPINQNIVSDPSIDLDYVPNQLAYGSLVGDITRPDFDPTQPTTNTKTPVDFNGYLSNGLELAPIVYNTFRGISKPEKVQRNYFTPNRYQYTDISSPARRAAQEAYNVDKYNINRTRGTSGQLQSYLQSASNNKYKRLADIATFEGGRKTDVFNKNTELENQAQLTNLQLSNQYNDIDARNRAKRNDFLAASTGQVSAYSQNKQLQNNLRLRDERLRDMDIQRLGLYNYLFPNYQLDYSTTPDKKLELKGIKYRRRF